MCPHRSHFPNVSIVQTAVTARPADVTLQHQLFHTIRSDESFPSPGYPFDLRAEWPIEVHELCLVFANPQLQVEVASQVKTFGSHAFGLSQHRPNLTHHRLVELQCRNLPSVLTSSSPGSWTRAQLLHRSHPSHDLFTTLADLDKKSCQSCVRSKTNVTWNNKQFRTAPMMRFREKPKLEEHICA